MKDTEFFSELLNIRFPWHITRLELNHWQKRVDIWIEHASGVEFPCPECRQFFSVYDHAAKREIRHLNTCQMATYLYLRVPRVRCEQHGVKQIVSGLGENNATTTYEFESLVLIWNRNVVLKALAEFLTLTGNWPGEFMRGQ